MQDINLQLRQSYYSLLQGSIFINNIIVPCYYLQAPAGTAATPIPNCYIIFNPITNTGFKDFTRDHTQTNFTVLIVTKYPNNNSGAQADSIAGQIFNIIQPGPGSQVVAITNGQVVSTSLAQDIGFGNLTDGLNKIVNRAITFTHKIVHYPFVANAGNIFFFVQDTTADPTDWSNSIDGNPALPISINYGSQPNPKIFGIAYLNTFAIKTDYQDLNDTGNSGTIGADTDLFGYRIITHDAQGYIFIFCRYKTNFNGTFTGIKYF